MTQAKPKLTRTSAAFSKSLLTQGGGAAGVTSTIRWLTSTALNAYTQMIVTTGHVRCGATRIQDKQATRCVRRVSRVLKLTISS